MQRDDNTKPDSPDNANGHYTQGFLALMQEEMPDEVGFIENDKDNDTDTSGTDTSGTDTSGTDTSDTDTSDTEGEDERFIVDEYKDGGINTDKDEGGINPDNILQGTRARTKTDIYEHPDHRKLLLQDIEDDEYEAAVLDEDLSGDEEDYTDEDEEEDDEEDTEDDDEDYEPCKRQKF